MGKKKCRGGVCGLRGLPKATPTAPSQPIFPQAMPQQQSQRPYQAVQPMNQMGQGIPQNYNPQASLQQQMAPLGQAQQNFVSPITQQLQQGPAQGQANWHSPYALQQQGQFNPQQSQFNPAIPRPNQQNTAIPQGQVMHPTGKQRGKVGRFFSGSRPQVYNNPIYNQYQNDALNYLTQFGLEGLDYLDQNEPGNQFDFSPIGNQELERFYSQTVPSIAERFTSMGGGQRSSAFQGALANAGRGLGNDLASQQQQYNLQQQQLSQNQYGMNQNLYTNLLQLGLRPQFESNLQPGRGGVIPGLIDAGAKIAGTALRGGF